MNLSEERPLSSAATIWLKFGAPIVWLLPLGGWAAVSLVGDVENAAPSAIIFLAFAWLSVFWHFPLKKVSATPEGLRVSNYLSSASVSYDQILRVRECKVLPHRPITILVKPPCRFGRKFRFTPRGHWYSLFWWFCFRDHPVATWLRDAARLAHAAK